MGFKLPEIVGWVDLPIYDGMRMECWLNPVKDDYEPPEDAEPWESTFFRAYGNLFRRLLVPADVTDTGEEEIIELGSARAVWDLTETTGFDQSILPRAMGAWSDQREALLEAALKN